jgi:hypothetical protein
MRAEQQVLKAVMAADAALLVEVISQMNAADKKAVSPAVFDTALLNITCCMDLTPASRSRLVVAFLQAVGPYVSSVAASNALQAMPRQALRAFSTNVISSIAH